MSGSSTFPYYPYLDPDDTARQPLHFTSSASQTHLSIQPTQLGPTRNYLFGSDSVQRPRQGQRGCHTPHVIASTGVGFYFYHNYVPHLYNAGISYFYHNYVLHFYIGGVSYFCQCDLPRLYNGGALYFYHSYVWRLILLLVSFSH